MIFFIFINVFGDKFKSMTSKRMEIYISIKKREHINKVKIAERYNIVCEYISDKKIPRMLIEHVNKARLLYTSKQIFKYMFYTPKYARKKYRKFVIMYLYYI